MAIQISIAPTTNGFLKITAGGTGSGKEWMVAPNMHILPWREHAKIICISESPNDWNMKNALRLDWSQITSPVVTSRNDAIEKITALQSGSAGIYQTTISGGTGASVTVNTFTFTSDNYLVYADGILMTSGYTRALQVVSFSPAIADGVVITIIKL